MLNEFSRFELLIGKNNLEKLANSRIAVFGIGGVGGQVCEALARSGVGILDLFDNDLVSLTNINRQIIALHSTIGRYKVEVMKERCLDINPNIKVNCSPSFINDDNIDEIDFTSYDYIIDAIDTVSSKLLLIKKAHEVHTPIISSMGAGNKLNPVGFKIADINKTSVCPLARVIRKKVKEMGIKHLKVAYSEEIPLTPKESNEKKGTANRPTPGSASFVPTVCGLIIAGEVVNDLIVNH